MVQVDYSEPSVEKSILNETINSLGITIDPVMDMLTDNMIKVANEIRKLFVGSTDGLGSLSVTMSTRTLQCWTNLMVTYKRAPKSVRRFRASKSPSVRPKMTDCLAANPSYSQVDTVLPNQSQAFINRHIWGQKLCLI